MSKLFRLSFVQSGVAVLTEFGIFDSAWRKVANYLVRSRFGGLVKEKFNFSDEELAQAIVGYSKFLVFVAVTPQGKIVVPCMLAMEILKLHISYNNERYGALAKWVLKRLNLSK